MVTLILGRDGMGDDASEDDFASWVSYVCEQIDGRAGFTVDVEERPRRDMQTDMILSATRGQREIIGEAKEALWDAWCWWRGRSGGRGAVVSKRNEAWKSVQGVVMGSMECTPSKDNEHVARLRKAILSAASLLQEVPDGELPAEDTLDFLESDIAAAQSALEDIQDCMPKEDA
jgi:hypothetical protein